MTPPKGDVVIVMSYPAGGKTTIATSEEFNGYSRLNRDLAGGSLNDLISDLHVCLRMGKNVVLDNTYATAEKRKPVIEVAKTHGARIRCIHLDTSIEDAQVNASLRMIRKYGKLLTPDEIAAKKDPNTFPAIALFAFRKEFQPPKVAEGFDNVEVRKFVRLSDDYKGEGILLDRDGTITETLSGEKYPRTPGDIRLLPHRAEKLKRLEAAGLKLIIISNQGDVARGKLTYEQAVACFEQTNKLLGMKIEYHFCPHNPAPINCFCRKPMPGFFVQAFEKHKLARARCVYVGDRTTDKTAAGRAGIRYEEAEVFFGKGK